MPGGDYELVEFSKHFIYSVLVLISRRIRFAFRFWLRDDDDDDAETIENVLFSFLYFSRSIPFVRPWRFYSLLFNLARQKRANRPFYILQWFFHQHSWRHWIRLDSAPNRIETILRYWICSIYVREESEGRNIEDLSIKYYPACE